MDVELHVLPLAETSKFVTEEEKKTQKVNLQYEENRWKYSTSSSSVSPLDELLEDLPSQAVADLHYVWLQGDRHRFLSVSMSYKVCEYILCALLWTGLLSAVNSLDRKWTFMSSTDVPPCFHVTIKWATLRRHWQVDGKLFYIHNQSHVVIWRRKHYIYWAQRTLVFIFSWVACWLWMLLYKRVITNRKKLRIWSLNIMLTELENMNTKYDFWWHTKTFWKRFLIRK